MKKGRFRGQFLRINYDCPIDPDSWYIFSWVGATGHYVLNRNTEGN